MKPRTVSRIVTLFADSFLASLPSPRARKYAEQLLVLILMLVAYGWPLAQFAVEPSPAAIVHRVE